MTRTPRPPALPARRPVPARRENADRDRTLDRPVVRLLTAAVTVVVTTAAALLLAAAPASAHTRLVSSDPADGSSRDDAPTRVSLLFNEGIEAGFATVTVVGPDGNPYQTGAVSTSGGEVAVGVSPLGPAGVYQVGYRVVSDDGHPVQGAVSFTLTTPGPGAAPQAPPADPAPAAAGADPAPAAATGPPTPAGDGGSTWPWLIGALVAVGAGGAGVAAALRRRSGGVRRR